MSYEDALKNLDTNKNLIDILANQNSSLQMKTNKLVVEKLSLENRQLYKTQREL